MSPLLFYLAKMILISGVLYSYYWCCLRNATFHGYNRCFLLLIPLISLVLPLLEIPFPGWPGGGWSGAPVRIFYTITAGHWGESDAAALPPAAGGGFFSGINLYYGVYFIILVAFSISLVRSLLTIRRMCRTYSGIADVRKLPRPIREGLEKIRFYITDEPGTPFSFFRHIFWNRQLDLTSVKSQQVFRHELYHVQQGHSADILYLEILRILFWFNPFFHLIAGK